MMNWPCWCGKCCRRLCWVLLCKTGADPGYRQQRSREEAQLWCISQWLPELPPSPSFPRTLMLTTLSGIQSSGGGSGCRCEFPPQIGVWQASSAGDCCFLVCRICHCGVLCVCVVAMFRNVFGGCVSDRSSRTDAFRSNKWVINFISSDRYDDGDRYVSETLPQIKKNQTKQKQLKHLSYMFSLSPMRALHPLFCLRVLVHLYVHVLALNQFDRSNVVSTVALKPALIEFNGFL